MRREGRSWKPAGPPRSSSCTKPAVTRSPVMIPLRLPSQQVPTSFLQSSPWSLRPFDVHKCSCGEGLGLMTKPIYSSIVSYPAFQNFSSSVWPRTYSLSSFNSCTIHWVAVLFVCTASARLQNRVAVSSFALIRAPLDFCRCV